MQRIDRRIVLHWLLAYVCALTSVSVTWYVLGRAHPVAEPGIPDGKKLQCVSYAPFAGEESPFDFDSGLQIPAGRIATDLALLSKRFNCVRTYSTEGLEEVPAIARSVGLQVLLGAWVNGDTIASQRELNTVITLARKYPDVVRAIVVGNEALLRKELTGKQLAIYIQQVKAAIPEVPVTYADVWEFWLKHPEVAPATDFITIHLLPYWEDDPTGIDDAMKHIKATYDEVARKIPGKPILIGETGWPSAGRSRENAIPSRENQARFIRGFIHLAEQENWQYNLVEAFDQPWKRINEGAVGGYWGLFDTVRSDKGVFSGAISNLPRWHRLWLASVAIITLTLGIVARHPNRSARQTASLMSFITVGAVMLPLQGHQFAVIARNGWEYIWAVVVLGLATAAYFVCIQAISTRRALGFTPLGQTLSTAIKPSATASPRTQGLLRAGVMFCAMIEVTGLVFDARYRSFNTFAFVIPALGYWLSYVPTGERDSDRAMEKLMALFLGFGAVFIVANEWPSNLEALAWAGACLSLAVPVWREARFSTLVHLKTMVLASLMLYAGFAAIRYNIMESVDLVGTCSTPTNNGLCLLREAMGKIIHFNGFGWLGLTGVALTVLTRRRAILWATLAVSIAGLTLYNAGLSSFSFVISILLLGIPPRAKTPALA